jgi:ethanolamine utilization protein EutQ (cupin superfamily)
VELAGADDKAETQVGVPPPANGTIFRIVDFPPVSAPSSVPRVDRNKMLMAMGLDPVAQGYARHPNTHRTKSMPYALVLDGEIDMLMDDSEVHLKAGDVLIQQGANHAWVNSSGRNCRIAFVLIDATPPPAWKQSWKA